MNHKALSEHLKAILKTEAWKQVELAMDLQREAILKKGKANRKDEAGIKCWAELDGFDKARMIVYRMSEYKEEPKLEE